MSMEQRSMFGKYALTPIAPEYYEFVRLLRQNPRVKDGFIKDEIITSEQQIQYMDNHLDSYYVGLLYGEYEGLVFSIPAGYVGVIENDIRICTDPEHQGKGIGKFMLSEIIKIFPNATGKIKKDNLSSQKLFDSVKVPYTLI